MQRLSGDLLGVALSRKGAPSWVRARAAVGEAARRKRLDDLGRLAPEALCLHTCERLEVCAVVDTPLLAPWETLFGEWLGLEPDTLRPHLEVRRGDQVVHHLLRVAAGLESRIVGETQVRLQLLQAWRQATEARVAGPVVSALARVALHASRRVRRETPLGRGRESLVTLVLAHLRRELGPVGGRRVAVAGTGAVATQLVPALRAEGATIVVTSREASRAAAFAERHRVAAASRRDIDADGTPLAALVTCTHGMIDVDLASLGRRGAVVLDLGVPPNLRVDVDRRPAVRLSRLEDLESVAPASAVRPAERIVAEEAARFARWRRERTAAPLVAELLRARSSLARPSPEERHALHLEILRLKAHAAA